MKKKKTQRKKIGKKKVIKRKKHARKTKKQVKIEEEAVDVSHYSTEIVPGYVWAFLRASAGKSKELFEHEHEYLMAMKAYLEDAIKVNGAKNFCNILVLQLEKLLLSMQDGAAPHLDILPYLYQDEPTPKGFVRTRESDESGENLKKYRKIYEKVGYKLHRECKKCKYRKNIGKRRSGLLVKII